MSSTPSFRKMVLLLFSVALFKFSYFVHGQEDFEYDMDSSGNVIHENFEDISGSRSVTFENNYSNQSITLFWEDVDGSRVKMGGIGRNAKSSYNSYINHKFFASTDSLGEKRVSPRQITVVSSKSVYSFGPASTAKVTSHPLVKMINAPTTATSAKFRNLIPATIDIYYEDGGDGVFQGTLDLGKEYTINTYEGHVFYFTEKGRKDQEVARFVIDKDVVMYAVQDPARPAPAEMLQHRENELKFGAEYLARTGLQWRHYYGPDGPRPPPVLHMWPADRVGDVHTVTSGEGQWLCQGSAAECQSTESVTLNLEVISERPRAFIIKDFLSAFECEEIIRLANPHMHHSIVGDVDTGAFESDTRTSRNMWVKRGTNKITESLFLRAADLLQVDETLLHRSANAEDMQVVHYVNGQKYDSHHDWGVSGYVESRFITLLLYLTDMESPTAGGETAFPKAADGNGIKIHPGKGSAVLFYNLLEDGNGDDLALHAALPLLKGEKWLANFWVWDPKFNKD